MVSPGQNDLPKLTFGSFEREPPGLRRRSEASTRAQYLRDHGLLLALQFLLPRGPLSCLLGVLSKALQYQSLERLAALLSIFDDFVALYARLSIRKLELIRHGEAEYTKSFDLYLFWQLDCHPGTGSRITYSFLDDQLLDHLPHGRSALVRPDAVAALRAYLDHLRVG